MFACVCVVAIVLTLHPAGSLASESTKIRNDGSGNLLITSKHPSVVRIDGVDVLAEIEAVRLSLEESTP